MRAEGLLDRHDLTLVKTLSGSEHTGRFLYQVRHRRLHVQYALKQLDLNLNDERTVLHEVQALNRLPFGVAPHCHGIFTDQGSMHILMDWIEGVTLSAAFESPVSDRQDLVRRLQALQLAANKIHEFHQARIYHRDIKPENILVRNMGRQNTTAHVIDFGLAVQNRPAEEGTVRYRAPEQYIRRQLQISAGTDTFSLGQVGWFLLSGQPKTLYPNLDFTDWDRNSSPMPEISDEVPRSLLKVLDKATAFSPQQRQANMLSFASGVSDALRGLEGRRRRGRREAR